VDISVKHLSPVSWEKIYTEWQIYTWEPFGWGIRGAGRHERPSSPPIQSSQSRADLRAAAAVRSWSPTVPCRCRDERRPLPRQRAPAAAAVSVVDVEIASRSMSHNDGKVRQTTSEWTDNPRHLYDCVHSRICSRIACSLCVWCSLHWPVSQPAHSKRISYTAWCEKNNYLLGEHGIRIIKNL